LKSKKLTETLTFVQSSSYGGLLGLSWDSTVVKSRRPLPGRLILPLIAASPRPRWPVLQEKLPPLSQLLGEVAPHYMHDLQNKELTKFAICNRLILRSLHFCGQVERCRKNEFIQEMRAGMLLGPFGLLIAKLSTKISMSHIKKCQEKRGGGRDFSQRIEIRRLEIGGICGG